MLLLCKNTLHKIPFKAEPENAGLDTADDFSTPTRLTSAPPLGLHETDFTFVIREAPVKMNFCASLV